MKDSQVSSDREWVKSFLRAPQSGGTSIPSDLSVRQRQIIYRCKQRGWLELDVILGNWATQHVPHLESQPQLDEIEQLLTANTPDVLKWILNHQPPPPHFNTPTLRSIQAFALGHKQP